jgi:excisionase family DNA binding protein
MTQTEVLLNAREVAALLGVEQTRVKRAAHRGEIPYLRLGRYLRFRQESIMEWVKRSGARNGAPRRTRAVSQRVKGRAKDAMP